MNENSGKITLKREPGTEEWKISSGRFSISPRKDFFILNFWVESNIEPITKLADSGDMWIAIEVVLKLDRIPDFSEAEEFAMPDYELIKDNWGEEKDYFYNFYYFDHRDIDQTILTIQRKDSGIYNITLTGQRDDPIDSNNYSKTNVVINCEMERHNDLQGNWATES